MGSTATTAATGRRDRKKQQTRAALIAAALRLVDERGLDRVTVEEISEAADVSPRTFFNYFATKDDALIGAMPDGPSMRERLLAVPAGVPLVPALLEAMLPDIAGIQAERDVWLLRMRVIRDNPSLLPILVARGECAEQETVAAVAARTGLPADSMFPQLAATLVGAALRTAMMRWATDGRDLAELVREAFELLASGLAEPPAGPRPSHQEDTR
ncbi:TetR family transcriptional regulator [Actinoplanes sp. URMC 104]|uniref:acyl-CoA-like ligand-binding transcription factor n=1 Tax=Actinoplanes sp. URMC 104 TaxID=3423409 RepID=UPI003F1BB752